MVVIPFRVAAGATGGLAFVGFLLIDSGKSLLGDVFLGVALAFLIAWLCLVIFFSPVFLGFLARLALWRYIRGGGPPTRWRGED